jgi:uncharacterized membrane protein
MEKSEKNPLEDIELMREIALTAVFTTLVFLSTSLFQIALISSTGYFNLGESIIYLAGIIGGPFVGAFSGGVGASLADVFLGYGPFAPGTLIIKGLEGFFVGFFFHYTTFGKTRSRRIFLSIVTTFIIAFSVYVTTPALNRVPESQEIVGSLSIFEQIFSFQIPGFVLVIVAISLSIIIWYIELKMEIKGRMILSCLLAGPIIIVGYFLWEIIIIQIDMTYALFEVPFNIAQVVFGTFIAVPVVTYLEELGIVEVLRRKMFKREDSLDFV